MSPNKSVVNSRLSAQLLSKCQSDSCLQSVKIAKAATTITTAAAVAKS